MKLFSAKFVRSALPAIILLALYGFPATAHAQYDYETAMEDELEEIFLTVGELKTVKLPSLSRVSVTDPGIADVAEVDATGMLLIGKDIGETALFYWDEGGKHSATIYVYKQKLSAVKDRLQRLFAAAKITDLKLKENPTEGKVVISGDVREYQRESFEKIIFPFDDVVINLTQGEEIEDLIQIDMQITELSSTLQKMLGIDWITGSQEADDDGDVTTTFSADNPAFDPTFLEVLPGSTIGSSNIFDIGQFGRSTGSALVARINALVNEGEARILQKPKVVVTSGEEARFLVGGEIPIRQTFVVSGTGGAEGSSVEYKEYGVGMTVTPTVKKGKIDILLNVEISDIDTQTIVGTDVAFTTRTAQTRLYLDDRETVVLAGLIRSTTNENRRRIPYLSKIPIFGLMFRSKNVGPTEDREIVISLTPSLLKQRGDSKDGGDTAANKVPRKTIYDYYNAKQGRYPGVPQGMVDYIKEVQKTISGNIRYPTDAMDNGWEGTVKLDLLILSDGTLAFAAVKESSGYKIFDEQALQTAKYQSAPFAQFPPDAQLQELEVTIPIVYSLSGF